MKRNDEKIDHMPQNNSIMDKLKKKKTNTITIKSYLLKLTS